jgi:heme-degrading monooxygenase HmoA
MFSVIFEVRPRPEQWDAYLGNAKMLRPDLEKIDGFVDNIRYRSLTREGWILSLSNWRDEKALVRWRTLAKHHEVQSSPDNSIASGATASAAANSKATGVAAVAGALTLCWSAGRTPCRRELPTPRPHASRSIAGTPFERPTARE